MKVMRPWLVNTRTIEYREEDIVLTPDKVLVKHVCTAPSLGTALHMYRGDHLAVDNVREDRPWPYPWLQGFAYGVGRAEEVGGNVLGFKPGDLVYCMKLTSDLAVANPADLTLVPDGVDAASASTIFQAVIALQSVRAADLTLGDNVFVTGQGTIGVYVAEFAKLAGAWQVIVADLSEKRLSVARKVGVDVAVNAAKVDAQAIVKELTDGRGADVAFEVSGSPVAFKECTRAAAAMGRVAVVGWIMHSLDLNFAEELTPKGLEVVVTHAHRRGHRRQQLQRVQTGASRSDLEQENRRFVLDLMQSGRLVAEPLITHQFPLSDLVDAWEFIDSQQSEYTQVVFVS